jgi:hypothetical protein
MSSWWLGVCELMHNHYEFVEGEHLYELVVVRSV